MKARKQFLLSSTRRTRRVLIALLAAGAATTLAGAALAPSTTASAASLPGFRLGVRSIDVNAGASSTISIRFDADRRSAFRWSFADLPASVTPSVSCGSPRVCTLTLNVAANAADSTSLVDVIAQSGLTRRVASFALGIHSRPAVIVTPIAPTTPTTPTTPTAPTGSFALRPSSVVAVTQPGSTVAFPIAVVRDNWSGPIALVIDNLPSGWRARVRP